MTFVNKWPNHAALGSYGSDAEKHLTTFFTLNSYVITVNSVELHLDLK